MSEDSEHPGVRNIITGPVSGPVVQAGNVRGSIRIGPDGVVQVDDVDTQPQERAGQ